MDYAVFTEDLKKVLQPILDEEAIELVELITVSAGKRLLLRLLVDKNDGRISLGDCASLNRKIRDFLDTGNIIKQDYMLEVSSPGVDRILKVKKDFARCINKNVKFFLREKISGRIELNGVISHVEENKVIIDIGGRALDVPLDNIIRAKQIIE